MTISETIRSGRGAASAARLTSYVDVEPLKDTSTFKSRAYTALKEVIMSLNIYEHRGPMRLDERQLAQSLGVSRTPVREAMAQLEREGFVRLIPRRGIYVTRKSKQEVVDMIEAWAALEGMAARRITKNASDREIASLRRMFEDSERDFREERISEYSEVNIQFHQAIIELSGNGTLISLAENLFTHMRMIRQKTIVEKDRLSRSMADHLSIIEAIERRDTDRAEGLVRDHALGLAAHVTQHGDYLD